MASVIIPTKNPGAVLRQVLAAVLGQNTTYPFDVLVIDSGSTDGTVEYVQSLQNKRLRLHQIAPAEFGHGRTRNLAVSLTTGKYVVMITHDACPVADDWLQSLVAAAEQDERIAGVFGRHVAYPAASPFTAWELEAHFAGFDAQPVVCLGDRDRYANDVGYRQFLHFFSDNNALLRRTVWEQIPYPDVDFAEDQLWAKQMIEAGWCKAYSARAVVYHSHDYGLWERLQRSFDESHAFWRHFGYVLCPGPRALLRSWAALTRRDLGTSRARRLWRSHPGTVLRVPLDNLMRVMGHYLGARAERLPAWMVARLSRDRRVLAGLLRLNNGVQGERS